MERELSVQTGMSTGSGSLAAKMDPAHDLQIAMDSIFGLTPRGGGHAKKFGTLSDLYIHYTGDSTLHGRYCPTNLPPELRASQAIHSGSFPTALANTLNRFLSIGYNKINYFEHILISQKNPTNNLHKASYVQLGNWGDLPDIDPEAVDYPDMPGLDEKGTLFDLLQKGCVIPVSRKAFTNDDLDVIKAFVVKLGLVARKTHARYAWDHFIANANSNDGTPWFSANHGNEGNVALSIASLSAAITALANMAEPGPSIDKIGIDLSNFKWHLVIPPGLWEEAVKINQTRSYYTSNDLTSKTINPCFRLFGNNNERIATPQFLGDGAGWGVIRDPSEVPILEMQYLDGKQEPEIYFDQNPLSDRAIKGDWFGLKARHEYGGAISDHRGGYKSIPE